MCVETLGGSNSKEKETNFSPNFAVLTNTRISRCAVKMLQNCCPVKVVIDTFSHQRAQWLRIQFGPI